MSGTLVVGSTLTASTGSWSGDAPITFSYQWQRCDSTAATCINLGGATSSSYVLASFDGGDTVRVAVTAANVSGSQTAYSAATSVIANAPGAPSSTALPTITGTPQAGSTLTATTGTWSGTPPMNFSIHWLRCDSSGANCAAIIGVTGQTYQLVQADVGSTMAVDVLAVNMNGNTRARSAATAPVVSVPSAPAPTALPTISGTTIEGMTLSGSAGTWIGTQPITFAYSWRRCDTTGPGCQTIAGATSLTYVLGHDDVGHTIRIKVAASNSAGSASATSAQTAIVTAAPRSGGQPSSKELCKHYGWRTFTNPSFRNQGQCIKFAISHSGGNGHHEHSEHDEEADDHANERASKSHGESHGHGKSHGESHGHGKSHGESHGHGKSHGRHGGGGDND